MPQKEEKNTENEWKVETKKQNEEEKKRNITKNG